MESSTLEPCHNKSLYKIENYDQDKYVHKIVSNMDNSFSSHSHFRSCSAVFIYQYIIKFQIIWSVRNITPSKLYKHNLPKSYNVRYNKSLRLNFVKINIWYYLRNETSVVSLNYIVSINARYLHNVVLKGISK